MEFRRINHLLANEGFGLRSWDDRYSKGIWVCIALNASLLEEIEDSSSLGDLDMEPVMEYVFSAEWLPFVTGRNLAEALMNLEGRLAKLPEEELSRMSAWTEGTNAVLEHLKEVLSSSTDYGSMYNKFNRISPDYKKVWA